MKKKKNEEGEEEEEEELLPGNLAHGNTLTAVITEVRYTEQRWRPPTRDTICKCTE